MRAIEKKMVNAVNTAANWHESNTAVKRTQDGGVMVTLHGNAIFKIDGDGRASFTLAGWNTPTTRSRLNALGVGVCQRNWSPVYDGAVIDSREWYAVK